MQTPAHRFGPLFISYLPLYIRQQANVLFLFSSILWGIVRTLLSRGGRGVLIIDYNQSHHLLMTSDEMSVNATTNSPSQDYTQLDDGG